MISKIHVYRSYHNWTQQELADKVGVRRETIHFLEKGSYNPSLRLAWKLAEALRVDIKDLFSFGDENHETERRQD